MKARLNKHHKYIIDFDTYSGSKYKLLLQQFIDNTWNAFVEWNPLWRNKVKLDTADTWSAQETIALIAHPLLKQLRATKHGYAYVPDEDVPDSLKTHNIEHDEAKYNWVLDEIIWALDEIATSNVNAPELDSSIELFDTSGESWVLRDLTDEEELAFNKFRTEHDAYDARIQNGCALFGKYFQSLWD